MGPIRKGARSKSPDHDNGVPPGLRGIVQKRFLNDVFQGAADKCPGWKVLIVDSRSMKVISTSVGMYDIMERRITLVESLEKKRAPFPNMDAIYVMEPTSISVSFLIEDFSRSQPLYGKNVFLYFLGRLSDDLFGEIKGCKPLLKRLKGLTEVNIDFLAKEERAFTFDMRDEFKSLYLRNESQPTELAISEKLVTLCGTLNEYPHIRYAETSALATSLANLFHLKMDEFVSQNTSWWYHGGPNKGQQVAARDRATLLILDRANDALTPLMHEYTYECMVHDYLELDGDKITYEITTNDGGKDKKDVLLDDKDVLWTELRGKHIAEVIKIVSDRIRDVMSSDTSKAMSAKPGEGNLSMGDMAAALKALPEYQEVLSKLGQHLSLAQSCMGIFTRQSIMELADLEQTMATGQDDEGNKSKLADIIDMLEASFNKIRQPKDRLRLILLATIALGGLRSQDRRRLIQSAELENDDERIVEALQSLGLPLINNDEKNRPLNPFHPKAIAPEDESEFQGSRFVPVLKGLLDDIINHKLSLEDYPSVLPMPDEANLQKGGKNKKFGGAAASARNKNAGNKFSAAGPAKKGGGGPAHFTGARIIVFYIGGLAYSELNICRELMEQEGREIVVGSTAFIGANEYIEDLRKLAEG